jgi:hypothetical protein
VDVLAAHFFRIASFFFRRRRLGRWKAGNLLMRWQHAVLALALSTERKIRLVDMLPGRALLVAELIPVRALVVAGSNFFELRTFHRHVH